MNCEGMTCVQKDIKWITELTSLQNFARRRRRVIVAAADVGHALIKAGSGPAQDAILQGDRKAFSTDINHP